ncbi:MAG: nucleotide sugar dehydrogenase [Bacillota bacterium]|nr:nucleotide sugar dehydrogenase [Bacillota bacterium]
MTNSSIRGAEHIVVVGLGYVGLPLAVAFSKHFKTTGFDINARKIAEYKNGIDSTREVGDDELRASSIFFSSDPRVISEGSFIIVAVPTPINADRTPDLKILEAATRTVGQQLSPDSVVCFESTVYPGVTEDICVPILEKESGLTCGRDFRVAYSPERINPGDKVHRLESIVKVVSGMDEDTLNIVADVYAQVVHAGVYRAKSIRVAEAAKVIENSQRDINIAFMNELAIIFDKLDIDTQAVLEAARTKWNFLNFHPGLVGGHCIGVDPYYLTYKAESVGYHSQIILSGRRINDGMGEYIAGKIIKSLARNQTTIHGAKVAIMGITFKENCPDLRNSKVFDIIHELESFGCEIIVSDPVADPQDADKQYGYQPVCLEDIKGVDAVVFAVRHSEYQHISLDDVKTWYSDEHGKKHVLIDIKGIFDRSEAEAGDFLYWRL